MRQIHEGKATPLKSGTIKGPASSNRGQPARGAPTPKGNPKKMKGKDKKKSKEALALSAGQTQIDPEAQAQKLL